jgi:signal transduction histidine kinase
MLEANCSHIDSQQVGDLRSVAAQTLDEVHNLAMQLRPRVLDDMGLPAALDRLTAEWQARYRIPIDLAVTIGDLRLPPAIDTALYRIIQEALTNTARHAAAQSVSILIERRNQEVVAVIEDDGQGFEAAYPTGVFHLGLSGMRERAELLGGQLTIESSPGKGTSIFVEIPISKEEIHDERQEANLAGG